MPPKLCAKGQLAVTGSAANPPARRKTDSGKMLVFLRLAKIRSATISSRPQNIGARRRKTAAKPRVFSITSAKIAPPAPSMLLGVPPAACVRLGSDFDQVRRLAQAAATPARRKIPPARLSQPHSL